MTDIETYLVALVRENRAANERAYANAGTPVQAMRASESVTAADNLIRAFQSGRAKVVFS